MQLPFSSSFFRRLEQLKMHTRRAFLGSGQGSHLSLRKGHGLEFADFRQYAPGDDFRHIDWGVYGRTDRLYVRQFREEQDLNVVCLLDTSHSMDFPKSATGTPNKLNAAKLITLALGYVALTDGDRVSFSFLGQKTTACYRGARALARASREFENIKPIGQINLKQAVTSAVAYQKIPGKCFVVSDFMFELDEIIQALEVLRARNFEISLVQILSPDEISLQLPLENLSVLDSETGEMVNLSMSQASKREYGELLADHIRSIEDYALRSEIQHILVSSDSDIEQLLIYRFPEAGILR